MAVRNWLERESQIDGTLVPQSPNLIEEHVLLSDVEAVLRLLSEDVSDSKGERRHLLAVRDLTHSSKVSCRSLCAWAEREKIPAVKIDGGWCFSIGESLTHMIAKRSTTYGHHRVWNTSEMPKNQTKCRVNCSGEGTSVLTGREREVLASIGRGNLTKEIAVLLGISESTVAEHRKRICRKLDLHSTAELVACAVGNMCGSCELSVAERQFKSLTNEG